jgi:hypothetical protein
MINALFDSFYTRKFLCVLCVSAVKMVLTGGRKSESRQGKACCARRQVMKQE